MMQFISRTLIADAILTSQVGAVEGVDIENMLGECRVPAATIFGAQVDEVEVKYEGQRVDKTHAVNGKVFVRGMSGSFQCSFEVQGYRIERFIVNNPAQ
jgi:hypothetical protein